jgi:hypothetical protein
MAALTGANTVIGLKIGSVIGTAVQAGAGDRMLTKLDFSPNTERLEPTAVGSGNTMRNVILKGGDSPSGSFDIDAGKFQGPDQALMALFFGADSLVPCGNGAYLHSYIQENTRNQKFATAAWEGASANVFEVPSLTPRKLHLEYDAVKLIQRKIEWLGDQLKITGTTNTNASLRSTTFVTPATAGSQLCGVVKREDKFRINLASGAALADGDALAVDKLVIDLSFNVKHSPEIKNAVGNGAPVVADDVPYLGTVELTLRNQSDFTWWTAQAAGTEYKADYQILGDLIGGSQYYQEGGIFPRLKLIDPPQYGLQSGSENPVTLKFDVLFADTLPTGMGISPYPVLLVKNGKATSELA